MWPTHTDIDELKHTIQEAALETQYSQVHNDDLTQKNALDDISTIQQKEFYRHSGQETDDLPF